jgi:hypothetical protein
VCSYVCHDNLHPCSPSHLFAYGWHRAAI